VRDVTASSEGDWEIFTLRVEANTDVREEVYQLANARHWTLRELSLRRATLEDVFVEITHPDEL
jgi:ABC-2 type transport system ATP-binding protein